MVTTTQPTIQHAKRIVEDEIDVVAAERDAFERLLTRLDRLDATTGRTAPVDAGAGGGSLLLARGGPSQDGMAAVRTAYRETVMAAPHYEREYGDSLAASLRTEFGDSLAEQVVAGGPLTPVVREALVDAAREALSDRTRFLDVLRTEQQSLESSERELDAVEARVVRLADSLRDPPTDVERVRDELDRLETRCAAVTTERQELVHDRSSRAMSGVEEDSLLAYLYDDVDARCPALADASACLRTIQSVRRDAVARC
jgi:predicted RNase H-like nuclease (RuvC/YqgF family)